MPYYHYNGNCMPYTTIAFGNCMHTTIALGNICHTTIALGNVCHTTIAKYRYFFSNPFLLCKKKEESNRQCYYHTLQLFHVELSLIFRILLKNVYSRQTMGNRGSTSGLSREDMISTVKGLIQTSVVIIGQG